MTAAEEGWVVCCVGVGVFDTVVVSWVVTGCVVVGVTVVVVVVLNTVIPGLFLSRISSEKML